MIAVVRVNPAAMLAVKPCEREVTPQWLFRTFFSLAKLGIVVMSLHNKNCASVNNETSLPQGSRVANDYG